MPIWMNNILTWKLKTKFQIKEISYCNLNRKQIPISEATDKLIISETKKDSMWDSAWNMYGIYFFHLFWNYLYLDNYLLRPKPIALCYVINV
jgi:hypothetical protein